MATPLAEFLCPPGFAGPSGLRALAREGSAVQEAARFVRSSRTARRAREAQPWAARTTARDLQPVVLIPGFMAGDASLSLMSRHLRDAGHRTYRSRMHANVGCTQAAGEALERRVEGVAIKRGRKVTLVGHSLGGLLARGVAARRPDLVESIVTLGSPILAPGAAHKLLLWDLALLTRLQRAGIGTFMGEDCTAGDCARLSWEESQAPLAPGLGFTSVFSRRDGIVDWRSCLDPRARTVEVATSHLGMAFDPVVLDVVTTTLAADRVRRARTGVSSARLAVVPDASAG